MCRSTSTARGKLRRTFQCSRGGNATLKKKQLVVYVIKSEASKHTVHFQSNSYSMNGAQPDVYLAVLHLENPYATDSNFLETGCRLQELYAENNTFREQAPLKADYNSIRHRQKSWNGVAISHYITAQCNIENMSGEQNIVIARSSVRAIA